jgi:hypothetical protein
MRAVVFASVVLVLVVAALSGAGTAAQGSTPTATEEPHWLFVEAFDSATLTPDPATPGEYKLTLSGVDAAVLAFTDRPDRQVRLVPTADYAAAVANAAEDPLNATLVAPLTGAEPALVVVELRDATHDAAARTVTHRVAVLSEDEGPVRVAATPLAAPTEEQAFGSGHLFTDATNCYAIPCPVRAATQSDYGPEERVTASPAAGGGQADTG